MKNNYKTFRELLPDVDRLFNLTKEQLDYLFECVKQRTYRARNFCYIICSWQLDKLFLNNLKDRTYYLKAILELKGIDYMKKTAYELSRNGRYGDHYIWGLEELNPNELHSDVCNDLYKEQNPSPKYKQYIGKPKHKMKPYTTQPKASDRFIGYKQSGRKVTQSQKDIERAAERSGKKRSRRLGKLEIMNQLNEL